VDLGHIYGETLERQHKLRLFKDGKLKYQVCAIQIDIETELKRDSSPKQENSVIIYSPSNFSIFIFKFLNFFPILFKEGILKNRFCPYNESQ